MKLNKITIKVLSLLAIMLVSSSSVFAARLETVTKDYTTPGYSHSNYVEENGPGGVFFVTENNKLTLDVTGNTT